MPDLDDTIFPERGSTCWLCSKALGDAASATPLLGLGTLRVHRSCFDRALDGTRADNDTDSARGGGSRP